MPHPYDDLPVLPDLDAVAATLGAHRDDLYVRWSRGPATDLRECGEGSSRDSLTGIRLPGLSASSLAVEPWWGDRSPRLWVARRLYDYLHLRDLRGPGVRPWLLTGTEAGRGPDNEPLVRCHRPVAWIDLAALDEARELVESQGSAEWGPLDRRAGA
ncbi:hypothetical protein BJY16_004397 [Actinoplanes octamycinicus]|uniref:Uncharacterized protein n=1 Tax=Actinoplanes octamycinicus TaxID=135948 RepID=A0A7W7GZ50_9ACTN|nr:DUF6098 family protein [Actinoplanes octamycinicus]MBB4740938.1 hypothetical protein [Actinoplanes octamycinicus]GIE55845.1 hypothetical protein Aoc01nite_12470 [Actinoplanes octamycinicus]